MKKSNFDAFEKLLALGAPVNARDKSGLTVLNHAKEVQDESLRKKFIAALSGVGAVE